MARKRATTAMKEAAAAAAAAAVAAAANDDTDDEILDLEDPDVTADVLEGLRRLDQGGNRVTWYVHCDAPIEREGFVEKLRTEQLDPQRFKSKYGPGEYRVMGRTSDGHYVKGSHQVIKISGILAEPTPGAPGDALSLLREMRAADEKRAQQRTDDMKTYATILAGPLASITAALIARRPSLDVPALIAALKPQQSTLGEMTTALVNLKQLSGGDAPNNVDTILKLLDKLQDLPGGSGDTGWLGFFRDVIREAAPHAREFVTQLQQGAQPKAPSAPPAGALPPPAAPVPRTNGAAAPPATQAAPEPAPSIPGENGDMWRMIEPWLRRKAEDLHESAATNMDVELCAEHLLQAAEKKFGTFVQPQQLHDLLMMPDWWQHVIAFHPPLAPYQAWCDDVRGCLVGMLREDLGAAGAPPDSPPGDEQP